MKYLAIAFTSLVLAGCASNSKNPASANYGAEPVNNEQAVISQLKNELKDPDSVKIMSITKPRRGYATYGFGKSEFGWHTEVKYNAKNSYGGYVGAKTRQYLYLNGKYSIPHTYDINFLDNKSLSCDGDCPQ
uniref:Lipoprotein n=1 Tax=Pectobacterium carotovorum TaxID=554 RepID=A0A0K0MPT0_PECCA|nr:hypothetical protein [Pectobacterium carotovorum]AKG47447.1 hypothetical protein pA_00007 [Pectobacterium carotovorum]